MKRILYAFLIMILVICTGCSQTKKDPPTATFVPYQDDEFMFPIIHEITLSGTEEINELINVFSKDEASENWQIVTDTVGKKYLRREEDRVYVEYEETKRTVGNILKYEGYPQGECIEDLALEFYATFSYFDWMYTATFKIGDVTYSVKYLKSEPSMEKITKVGTAIVDGLERDVYRSDNYNGLHICVEGNGVFVDIVASASGQRLEPSELQLDKVSFFTMK